MLRTISTTLTLLLVSILFLASASAQDGSSPEPTDDVSLPELRAELLDRVEKDQAIRDTLQAVFQTYNGEVPDSIMIGLMMEMNAVDGPNAKRIGEIFEARGFPSIDMVGQDGVNAAFLLLQHAPLELQETYYEDVKAAYEAGEIDGGSYAILTDRIRVRNGEEQVYGTQTDIQNGEIVVNPIADSVNVDVRRDSVGLPPLNDYLELVRSLYLGEE